MLVFGHLGLTIGAAWALGHSYDKLQARKQPLEASVNKIQRLASKIDYRVVIIGSMLPDIIDKPLGLWVLHGEYGGGRSFFHTLLFALLLILGGLIWYKKKRGILLLTLALANITHLVLDEMWVCKETLLWPALGLSFHPADSTDISIWFSSLWNGFLTNPSAYIPETMGALIIFLLALAFLMRKGKLSLFIKSGKID
jgi:inner membrane protein